MKQLINFLWFFFIRWWS